MHKILVVAVVVSTFALAGCPLMKQPKPAAKPAAAKAERCPPGHRWSDGKCHAEGKGHDPGHQGKGHDKDHPGKAKGHDKDNPGKAKGHDKDK